jgi:Predicted flavoprotein
MPDPTLRLALLYGSDRRQRFCDTIAAWAVAHAEAMGGWSIDRLDPATPEGRDGAALERKVREADAFLVVTPEYNHGYPAALKAMIDAVYIPWQAKPVAFISYGGLSRGLCAVEQLRQGFASLHAVPLRDASASPTRATSSPPTARCRAGTPRTRRCAWPCGACAGGPARCARPAS